jgi:hypothetical protein
MTHSIYLITIALLVVIIIIAIWRHDWIALAVMYIGKDAMPIWLSVVLAISAAAGTYWIAPLINQDFEFQKNRSSHLLGTVSEINKDMVLLVVDVRKFNNSLFYEHRSLSLSRGNLLDQITQVQWRLLDVKIVIDRAKADSSCVGRLSNNLANLDRAVKEASKPEDQESTIAASLKASKEAQSCLMVLYKAAQLD